MHHAMSTREIAPGVTVTEGVCAGRPCIAGTRIETARVYGLSRDGYTMPQILRVYSRPLNREQVTAAIDYEKARTDVKVIVLPPELGDGCRESIFELDRDFPDWDSLLEEWIDSATAGDSITIEVRSMSREALDALPDL